MRGSPVKRRRGARREVLSGRSGPDLDGERWNSGCDAVRKRAGLPRGAPGDATAPAVPAVRVGMVAPFALPLGLTGGPASWGEAQPCPVGAPAESGHDERAGVVPMVRISYGIEPRRRLTRRFPAAGAAASLVRRWRGRAGP